MSPISSSCSMEVSHPCQSWPFWGHFHARWRLTLLGMQCDAWTRTCTHTCYRPGALGQSNLCLRRHPVSEWWALNSGPNPPSCTAHLSVVLIWHQEGWPNFWQALGRRGRIMILLPQHPKSLKWKLAAMSGRNKGEKIALWAIWLGRKYPQQSFTSA